MKVNTGKTAGSDISSLDLETCGLSEINQALKNLIDTEKNDWYKYYELIEAVERRELFAPEFASLTAWLRDFCSTSSLTEQRAWQIKRAGKVYRDYEGRHADAPDLSEIELPPQTLQNIEKASVKRFSGYDYDEDNRAEYMDKYIKQAINGELTRDGSHDLYVRERHAAQKLQDMKNNGDETTREEIVRNTETADEIKEALKNNWSWLGEKVEIKSNHQQTAATRNYYDFLEEFDISTPGEAQSKITADGVIMENITAPKGYSVNVHAIEIKASAYDYQRDKKYTDYRKYADFLWLVVPESVLLLVDPTDVPSYVGILAYNDGSAEDGDIRNVQEAEGKFLRLAVTVDDLGRDQITLAPKSEEVDHSPLYKVREAAYNETDDKKTEQLLRHWIVRKR